MLYFLFEFEEGSLTTYLRAQIVTAKLVYFQMVNVYPWGRAKS